tara:strand:+ start:84 stop:257 length:174 start_codon:yes stop_codon:yes gene_type:complete
MIVVLKQSDYQTFLKKVAQLSDAGIDVKYSVAKPNHKKVKVTMHTPVDAKKWDEVCG